MTTTGVERIESAIALRKPDRVPVAPIIDFFSSRYGGITQENMFFDIDKADLALQKTLNDLGSIDGFNFSYAGMGRILQVAFPTPPILPGVNGADPDAQFQYVEKSIMEAEEYGRFKGLGAGIWLMGKMTENHPELRSIGGLLGTARRLLPDLMRLRRSTRGWRRRGVEPVVSFNLNFTPMEGISMAFRSFNDFILDIFRRPEDIKAASKVLMRLLKLLAVSEVVMSGTRRVFLGGARTSASFLSPRQFEELALPEWEEMCVFLVRLGITPVLHLDSDWTAFFHYLKNLPARKCVLNLDGTSDIFKAKEVLGNHMCIMGDVPASLLKLGDPEEVDEYCRRLIMEIGADGGFILSSGCTMPVDAKPENVKAMLQSVKRY